MILFNNTLTKFVYAALLTQLMGCVSMQQMQNGMDEIDSFWGDINKKIIASQGSRIYRKNATECLIAAKNTASQLGFLITEEDGDSLIARAPTPTPFTKEEFKSIKVIEEPMMQAIAANHVGKFTSNFYYLDDNGKMFVILKVIIKQEETSAQTLVTISFQIEPKNKIKGFIYGHNPPPEALKKGLEKWWNAFEYNLSAT